MADVDAKVELLRQLPFLRAADQADLRRLAQLVEVLDVPGGRDLTTEGSPSEWVFILVDGTATTCVGGTRFESVGRGGIIGHVALLDHGRHHATATTDGDTRVIAIARRHFNEFVKDSAVIPGLSRLLAARMRFTEAELANGLNQPRR
jgi:CRP-like cAMP-binding protein